MVLTVPQLLVMLGAALLTVALFAPRTQALTLAPPGARSEASATLADTPLITWVRWPALADARAEGLDTARRAALLQTLIAIAEPWCEPILEAALLEEPDESLRALARACLARVQPTASA